MVPLDNETESDRNVVENIPNYGEKIDIRVYISKLKQKGLLVRIGPDKGGHW